jgi:hypothetical protein
MKNEITPDYRALCAELAERLDRRAMKSRKEVELITRARTLLAAPEAVGVSDEEVEAWADLAGYIKGSGDHPCGFWIEPDDLGKIVRNYAHATPVPVKSPELATIEEDAEAQAKTLPNEVAIANASRVIESLRLYPPERIMPEADGGVRMYWFSLGSVSICCDNDGDIVVSGRSPAPVPVVGVADEEWDALVERLWDQYETVGYLGERFMHCSDFGTAMDLARKELTRYGTAHPAPVPMLAEVIREVAKELSMDDAPPWYQEGPKWVQARVIAWARRKLLTKADELEGTAHPAPVSVGERLPGVGDCDAMGRCWWLTHDQEWMASWLFDSVKPRGTVIHWLPHWALPLPGDQPRKGG